MRRGGRAAWSERLVEVAIVCGAVSAGCGDAAAPGSGAGLLASSCEPVQIAALAGCGIALCEPSADALRCVAGPCADEFLHLEGDCQRCVAEEVARGGRLEEVVTGCGGLLPPPAAVDRGCSDAELAALSTCIEQRCPLDQRPASCLVEHCLDAFSQLDEPCQSCVGAHTGASGDVRAIVSLCQR
jgi:hypothetical protein